MTTGERPVCVQAGFDGVFLDGVVPYNLGCADADVNCTAAGCPPTPQPAAAALEAAWAQLYVEWFELLKAEFPELLWVNNLLDSLAPVVAPKSNGRMYEGTAAGGLNTPYSGGAISSTIDTVRAYSAESLKPSYIHLSMNSAIAGGWRVGRWQNLVSEGEMMRAMTDWRRMRFGLGVALMTDAYFANDIGGGWYGVPTNYVEYVPRLQRFLLF